MCVVQQYRDDYTQPPVVRLYIFISSSHHNHVKMRFRNKNSGHQYVNMRFTTTVTYEVKTFFVKIQVMHTSHYV